MVNTQRIPSPTLGPAPKTPIQEPKIVEMLSDWDKVEVRKTTVLIKRVEQDG